MDCTAQTPQHLFGQMNDERWMRQKCINKNQIKWNLNDSEYNASAMPYIKPKKE